MARSLASSGSPVIAGALLGATTFGWPLIIAGSLKIAYDLLLLRRFRGVRPAEELPTPESTAAEGVEAN